MKKNATILLIVGLVSLVLAACSVMQMRTTVPQALNGKGPAAEQTLKVAVFQGAYGSDYWNVIAERFEAKNPGVNVEVEANPEIGEMIRPKMLAGNGPDFIYLPSSNSSGIAQALIKDKGLVDLTDVFTDDLKEKILPGFLENRATSPYGDGRIYLAPLYYSSTGLFYNADLFAKEGWKVPITWDEFFALGEKAKEKGRALFTYQGLYPGYMEALLVPAMVGAVGPENFAKATMYQDGAWQQQGIIDAMHMIEKIGTGGYLMEGTVALDHTQAQSQWLMGKALFIPCGSWLEGEMKDAPKEDGFRWGFTASPVFNEDGDQYIFAAVEEMYIPKTSKNSDLAKKFLAFQYSDEAIALNAELAKGIPPVKGAVQVLKPYVEEATYATYNVFEQGYKPCIPRFASVVNSEVLPDKEIYNQLTGVMTGEFTAKDWANYMEKISDSVRDKVVR